MGIIILLMHREKKYRIGAAVTLAELEENPHAVHHRLREAEPVSWLPCLNAWVVTRRDLACEMMRDAKTFTVDHPGFSTGQVVGESMLSTDGERHLTHRQPFEYPFRLREVTQRFQKPVADTITHLIDGLMPNHQAELRREYAGPIATHTMITALGLTKTAVSDVLSWYDDIVDAVTRVTAGEPVPQSGKDAFDTLSQNLLPALRANPKTTLLAQAAGVDHGLTDEQIISNAAILLFGGIETTEGMIANALYYLLTHPDILETARLEPAGIPHVIEESLRLEPAAAILDRYATADATVGEAEIKKDDLIHISLSAANRDPAIFPNPDRFDPTRSNLRSHVTFAQGPHVCLGIHLARLEAQQAVHQLINRLPTIRLVNPRPPTGLVFRKPDALHAVWHKPKTMIHN